MIRSLFTAMEELTLLVLPHGGQRTSRRNAWRAAADLHVTGGYRWTDPALKIGSFPRPASRPASRPANRPVAATTGH